MCLKFGVKINQILGSALLANTIMIALAGDASSQTVLRICNSNDSQDFDENGRGQPGAFWPAYLDAMFKDAG